jgi:prolipoprotein diacylglyceryl transferase
VVGSLDCPAVTAVFPAPPFNTIGPLNLYGLSIAIGVLLAVLWARKRYENRGYDPDIISNAALWVIPAGLIGTRIYHVVTDYNRLYCGAPNCEKSLFPDALYIWEGGLGIPGGIAAGFLVGWWYARRQKLDVRLLMDVAAPAIPLAQAIGRWGNYFNQELFGRPTKLPWALEVDSVSPEGLPLRPSQYSAETTFHPTFLYESLWNLGGVGVILLLESKLRLKRGKLFPAYVTWYFLGRMWVESLRIDTAARVFGDVRWNFLLAAVMVALGLLWFFWGGPIRDEDEPYDPNDPRLRPAEDADGDDSTADDATSDDASAESSDDVVAESGPGSEGPGAEVAGGEREKSQSAVALDPDESS